MAELRATGSGSASSPTRRATRRHALAKYRRLGFDFTQDEVISSRDVAVAHLSGRAGRALGRDLARGDGSADIPPASPA